MKKAQIIFVGGMSSSMFAKKTAESLQSKGHDVEVTAVDVIEVEQLITDKAFDLFLISPQTKMYLKNFQKIGDEVGSKVIPIPPQAYIPVPMGIAKMHDLVVKEI